MARPVLYAPSAMSKIYLTKRLEEKSTVGRGAGGIAFMVGQVVVTGRCGSNTTGGACCCARFTRSQACR